MPLNSLDGKTEFSAGITPVKFRRTVVIFFRVTFDQFNAYLLNKSINKKKETKLSDPKFCMIIYICTLWATVVLLRHVFNPVIVVVWLNVCIVIVLMIVVVIVVIIIVGILIADQGRRNSDTRACTESHTGTALW